MKEIGILRRVKSRRKVFIVLLPSLSTLSRNRDFHDKIHFIMDVIIDVGKDKFTKKFFKVRRFFLTSYNL